MLPPRTETGTQRLFKHCIYMIATGKWRPGDRLPSIRRARREWGLNQEAVQAAYARLQAAGLAESRPRSGVYVRWSGTSEHLGRHRQQLRELHERVSRQIREETPLSVLGALRYLAQLEALERREDPEIVFVECTGEQALGHATEIEARLGVPVASVVLAELDREPNASHWSRRRVLTTTFHLEEVQSALGSLALGVTAIPIEVAPEIGQLPGGDRVLLETEESMASHIAADSASRARPAPRVEVVADPEAALSELLPASGASGDRIVLLSPRLWGRVSPTWREHPGVHPVRFRIVPAAWPAVAESCGMPVAGSA